MYKTNTKKEAKRLTAITKLEAMEKGSTLLSQNWKNTNFIRIPKIISHFGGTNNIFTDCKLRKQKVN